MKILLATGIYPPDAGGPATYTRAIARAFASEGHGVQVVCYGEKDEVVENDGYPVERIGRGRDVLTRYWNFFIAVLRRAQQADVVYLQGPVSEGLPGALGALIAGKPIVMKVVGDYAWEIYQQSSSVGATHASPRETFELLDAFLTHRHSGKIWALEMIERWTAKRAKKIIVPSEYLKSVVMKWGIPSERISVIYNAIEPLPEGTAHDEVRAALNIVNQRVLFTAVRAVPWKGVDFLINLLSDLPTDVLLVVAGDGPSLDAWKARAVDQGVQDRVRFIGRVDRGMLADWYRAADLFVLPSGYEGFPHVVIEAASAGLPSFVSDQGGNPETQKLLGENFVTVLPYLDEEKWRGALQGAWPTRSTVSLPDEVSFSVMYKHLETLLSSIV